MYMKACDRCGRVYHQNDNHAFKNDFNNGAESIEIFPRNYFDVAEQDHIHYDLCDVCFGLLDEFLNGETDFAKNGQKKDDVWIPTKY